MTGRPLHASTLVAVAVGGAAGAVLRHLLGEAFPVDGFPWTTLVINVSGSFLLALLPAAAVVRRHPLLPPALGPGLLGGYTTLSAYSEESRALLADGRFAAGSLYAVGTLALCLLAVALADRFSGPPERSEFEAEDGDL
ncbi:MAG TPA: CrcB family protein [Marmoricola sp.]|nr:CrcB family protein [Marmoricola sp.]